MYIWIDIAAADGFDLLATSLPKEYCPEVVAAQLQAGLTNQVKRVLIEGEYVDKDFRSVYYNYYAKKGRKYRADCVRLHLFDESVGFDPDSLALHCADDLSDHYFGYLVLRPTLLATIGRSMLSPDIRQGAAGDVIVSTHRVHLLGYKLHVAGFPSMDQHVDIAVCAHVACWSVLRHYSQRFARHAEFLLQEIIRMAHSFDPGGLVPSNGLDIPAAERVFQAAATYPLVVAKDKPERFYAQLLAYLESGFPLFVGMHGRGHAVVVVGHAFDYHAQALAAPSETIGAWQYVSHYNVVDDNHLPYLQIPRDDPAGGFPANGDKYSAAAFDRFIVALPEKIYYSATAVGKFAGAVKNQMGLKGEYVERYFVTTLSRYREEIRKNASQYSTNFLAAVMNLPAAQFIWIVEFATRQEWATGNITARAIIDATAGVLDLNPLWLVHSQSTAIVFDRSNAQDDALRLDISTVHNAPLTRMNLNLRPVKKALP